MRQYVTVIKKIYKKIFIENLLKLKKLQKVYWDYQSGIIDENEAYNRFVKIYGNEKKSIKYEQRMKFSEMSIYKPIVDYINYYDTVENAHKGTNFSALAETILKFYMNHIKVTGSTETLNEFLINIYDKYPAPKKEVEQAKDKKLLWDFIDDLVEFATGKK